ncbi:hypothetical protein J4465_00635 [Candidatus Pacearchaeota archaeon]|nr:hypothetical protein [Candidatus Pacearchaeota archaeon]
MSNKNPIYLGISLLALALSGLSIVGYVSLNKKYIDLDKKFDATADTLKQYKATLQNQGLYGPLSSKVDTLGKEIIHLRRFTEGFFGGSEITNEEFATELGELEKRIGLIEKQKPKTKNQQKTI